MSQHHDYVRRRRLFLPDVVHDSKKHNPYFVDRAKQGPGPSTDDYNRLFAGQSRDCNGTECASVDHDYKIARGARVDHLRQHDPTRSARDAGMFPRDVGHDSSHLARDRV